MSRFSGSHETAIRVVALISKMYVHATDEDPPEPHSMRDAAPRLRTATTI